MPRQNRVTPFGDIVASPARGTLMGNRGCLHDASGRTTRPYRLTAWIYCLLEFKGRRRAVMSPGKYTELFFLDEATALAAGHRPCAECQRARYNEFMACWGKANAGLLGGEKLRAPAVDAVLQRERVGVRGEKVTWKANVADLPVGVMVERDSGKAAVVIEGGTTGWSLEGYKETVEKWGEVNVLTPRSIVSAMREGFLPTSLNYSKVGP